MKTFKIDVKKFNEITDEALQGKVKDEMYELAHDKIYYIDEMGVLNFMTLNAWFEAMIEFDITVFYYTVHNKEDEESFYQDYKNLVEYIVEVVDRDKIIESVKVEKFGEKEHIDGKTYNGYKLDKEDLSAIKDLFQSGSFSEYSIMDLFGIDRETLYMIGEDDKIEII